MLKILVMMSLLIGTFNSFENTVSVPNSSSNFDNSYDLLSSTMFIFSRIYFQCEIDFSIVCFEKCLFILI